MNSTARFALTCCLILLIAASQATATGPQPAATTAPVRTTSGPPDLDSAAVELHWDSSALDFSWYYVHPGDYNQDGLVTVNDITPLGVNFNATGPFDEDSALSVVDGNSDGMITVNDITPIGQNFGKSLERYQVFYSDNALDYPGSNTAPNGAGATLLGTVQLINNPLLAGQRRHFTLHLASPPATGYAWVRPLSNEYDPGTPSNYVDLSGGSSGNTAPEASLVLSTTTVAPGTAVTLIASGSSDTDGDTLTYSFDPEGDGTFRPPASSATMIQTYRSLADIHPVVRVADGNGGTDEASATLTVTVGTANTSTVDSESGAVLAGQNVALVVADSGQPGVVYHDPTAEASLTLRWRLAQSTDGSSWHDQRGIRTGGPGLSAALVNGNPAAVCYIGGDIPFVRADSAAGNGTWTTDTPIIASLHSDSNQLAQPSLAVIAGQPALTCNNVDALFGGDLFYVRATNASGTAWAPVVKLVAKENHVAFQSSIAEVSGRPAVVYVGGFLNDTRLYYLRAEDEAGTTWPAAAQPITTESSHTFSGSCLQVIAGNPAVVYWDKRIGEACGEVCYLRAEDTTGSNWADPLSISESTGDIEADIDLAVVNDTPVIAFSDYNEGLKLFVAADGTGADWNDPVMIETGTDLGKSVQIAEVDGQIALAYYNRPPQQIVYTLFEVE